jgi:alkylation response protein AidB-like acyl-CoA dehydrogenase
MHFLLTEAQKASYREFDEFAASNVRPFAERWDSAQEQPKSIALLLGKAGYLGATLPRKYNGRDSDFVTFGLLSEALGRASSALANLITVQTMVSMTLLKWGTETQRNRWLPPLATGDVIGAFALTETGAGSATQSLQTRFHRSDDKLVLNGEKKWISYGGVADVFLVFGKLGDDFIACLVPRDTQGIEIEPIRGMLGFRSAALATVRFVDVNLSTDNLIGKQGFGLSHVASVGLHYGRLSTACSAAGLVRASFEESASYAAVRKIAGRSMCDIGMIQSIIARMGCDLKAAHLLCYAACCAEDNHLPESFAKALTAKYFSSKAAVRAAADAVQIQGALGCHESSSVARYYRDAKLMEILEGTSQIHEQLLGKIFSSQGVRLAS